MTTKSVHLIGIGGVGMAGLAVLLKARGHEVSGCDLHASSRTKWLEEQGIRVFIGHDPSHLAGVDEVVVTPAVSKNEPELVSFRGPIRYRGEVLAELVNESPDSIAVCGSHGKTTTATWIARLLKALGEDVAWCIGGETGSFPVAGATGKSKSEVEVEQRRDPVLVVEADESDGTLALYKAKTLVVNKCEYDHPDHFKTEADYFACYETAKKQAGCVVESECLVCGFSNGEKLLLGEPHREYAVSPRSDFSLVLKTLPAHNLRNMRAAIEVALRRGHAMDDIAKAMPAIVAELPDRRFQKVAEGVYTDYAHHPTEMKCAVEMARAKCTGNLRVLFQPHRYSRTKALLRDFPAAFKGADEVILCPTYSAFEKPLEGGDVADLYRACRERFNLEAVTYKGVGLFLARSNEEAWEHAFRSMKDGDLTLLLGAGDIISLVPQVQADMSGARGASKAHARRQFFIGAGSNTWKSDLNLNVKYVRTEGPANAPGASLGIPWMAGIPGTIGGWVKMNAGAFGHSISEVIAKVKVDGEWRSAAECGFSYRHSDITGEIQDVILKSGEAVSRPLQNKDGSSITSGQESASPLSAAYYLSRRKKFPAGTFGSFFKNPPGDYAGRLLEEAGAKELKVGGAYVWEEHANVIVRGPLATPSDVRALARLMRNRVLFRFGIALEAEVCGITF